MRFLYTLGLLSLIVVWSSCRNDFETLPSTGNLEFSRDTVYLDTVFSNIGSSTYNLKVYNRSDEDISIPSVRLGQGENSLYRLNVNGRAGKTFSNLEILAKDSIFVFVETTIDINTFPNNLQFLYTDAIEFDTGSNQQNVELVTLVQDAVFLFPERFGDGTIETLNLGMDAEGNDVLIEGFFLDDDELNFTNEKPYVIYGYAAVPPTKTLTVDAGARVHFHENSGLLVANQATIKANGALSSDPVLLENEIIFQGDRLEPAFEDIPGQWGTIWLTAGSTAHEFNFTTIKNAVVGILMDSNDGSNNPTLTIKNTQIYNSGNVGLLARTGNVDGENLVITNSGQSSLFLSLGGTYNFRHSTFGNYWNRSFRSFPAVVIDNSLQVSETEILVADLVEANFSNCIVYGSEGREFFLNAEPEAAFNFNFSNSLLRFEDPQGQFAGNPLFDFSNTAFYTNCVFNADPVFFNTQLNQLFISNESAANGIGNPATSQQVPFDLLGTPRGNPSDAGAYESVVFPED
ncbi:MAG: hypothetical protein NXH73_08700 [Flavobacteriaceae bacterium]|nr:hypothetical protein [Flavobacteriaceae bacterium]